jgi:hypothetical protein
VFKTSANAAFIDISAATSMVPVSNVCAALLLPYICRDDGAFRFWAERDRVLHTFYDENGEHDPPLHPTALYAP